MSKLISIEICNEENCVPQRIKGIEKKTEEPVTIDICNSNDGSGMFTCIITYDNKEDQPPIYQSDCCSKDEVEASLNTLYISAKDITSS